MIYGIMSSLGLQNLRTTQKNEPQQWRQREKEERQVEECTSIASYPAGSGPSSVPEDNDNFFGKGSMGNFCDKLLRYGQSQYC